MVATDDAAIEDASLIDAPPGAMPMTLTYPATVAECINPAVPSTATCRSVNGDTQMVVDADDSGTNNPWFGFVRFDIDDKVANKTVTAVRFQIRTTNNSKAPAPKSGEVWQVTPFTLASLSTAVPAHVGATPLGPDKGAVSQNITLTWTMPVSLVTANSGVYFSIESSSSDGTNYWNTSGTTPPKLIVDVQ